MTDPLQTNEQQYQATLDFLYSYIDYSLTRNFRYTPDKFNLGRMAAFMAILGNPQNNYPIIHVAGTKGKGSVSACCASVLQSAGLKTGFYTSPHLHDYCERIQINRTPIPHDALVAMVGEVKPAIDLVEHLTTFEITTGLAFLYFAREKVDAVVLEVGLGGRLDATNIITPIVSVITSLSLDHMNVLGNTLAEIAGEKAGIIKPGVPVVSAPQKEEARLVLKKVAQANAAPLIEVGEDIFFASWEHTLEFQSLIVWSPAEQSLVNEYVENNGRSSQEPIRLTIPLLGYHQVENAATAYAALQVVKEKGLPVTEKAIKDGFGSVVWPGRFEILKTEPVIVVDSAHNRDSALKLRLALDDYFPGKPILLVFGASEDKDIYGMFCELLPRMQRIFVTKSVHPRAIDPSKLELLARRFAKPVKSCATVEEAISDARNAAGKDAIILITGSLFIAAASREVILQNIG